MQSYDINELSWQKYSEEAHVVAQNRSFDATETMSLASNQQISSYNSTSGGSVNHKNSLSGKPIRRRSRVSKKTPITLLNANSSNFRALVQQFTGCHTATSTCFKGPVTLNFQRGSSCINSDNRRNSHEERPEQRLVSFGTNYTNNINAFTSDDIIDPLFASSSTVGVTEYAASEGDHSSTLDNFDIENFSWRDGLGGVPGDYTTSTWEATAASNDESWRYV